MLGNVNETAYDLNFSVLGIPVRVSMWFWVGGAILGYSALEAGLELFLAWLVILFISILVHELGHALVAKRFGYPPTILLYQFGGLASYYPDRHHTRGRSILISLAGPAAGFLLYELVRLFRTFGLPYIPIMPAQFETLMRFTIHQLIFINLYWGLVNLLPVLPLDGGRVCQALLSGQGDAIGIYRTAWVGVIVGGAVAAWFFSQQETYPAILFGMLAFSNYSTIQQFRSYR